MGVRQLKSQIERITEITATGGTTNLANNSRRRQLVLGTLSHTFVLPQANASSPNECPNGLAFTIANRSTQSVTVNFFGGALAKTLAAGEQATFRLVSNSTAAGTWDITNEAGGGGAAPLSDEETLAAMAGAAKNDSDFDLNGAGGVHGRTLRFNRQFVGGNVWQQVASMTAFRTYSSSADAAGYGFVNWGYDDSNTIQTTPERYDDVADRWMNRAVPVTTQMYGNMVGLADKIYQTGGSTTTALNRTTAHNEYNPVTNAWSSKAAKITASIIAYGHAIAGKLYIFGGRDGAGTSAVTTGEYYDPTLDAWATRKDLLAAKTSSGHHGYRNSGFIFGGYGNPGLLHTITSHEYDHVKDDFEVRPNTPIGRINNGVVDCLGVSYVLGGEDSSPAYVTTGFAYVKELNSFLGLTSLGRMPLANQPGSFALSGAIYEFNGLASGATRNTAYKLQTCSFFHIGDLRKSNKGLASIFVASFLNEKQFQVPIEIQTDGNVWIPLLSASKSSVRASDVLRGKFKETGLPHISLGYITSLVNVTAESRSYNYVADAFLTRQAHGLARTDPFFFALDGYTYFQGGGDSGGAIATPTNTEKYNPDTNTFQTLTTLATLYGADGTSMSLPNNKGYKSHGELIGETNGATIHEYDPTLDTWTPKTSSSNGRRSCNGFDLQWRLFSVGGRNPAYLATNEAYDYILNAWIPRASVNTGRAWHCAESLRNQRGMVFLGYNGSDLQSTEVYNPISNAWATKANNGYARIQAASYRAEGFVWAVLGSNSITRNQYYSDLTDTWLEKNTLSFSARTGSVASLPGFFRNYKVRVGIPFWMPFRARTWNLLPDAPEAGTMVAGYSDGFIKVTTGSATTFDYDEETRSWKNGAPKTYTGYGVSFDLRGMWHIIFGGDGLQGERYNPITKKFEAIQSVSGTARARFVQSGGAAIGGFGYEVGGSNLPGSVEIADNNQYNPDTNTWLARQAITNVNRSYSTSSVVNGLWFVIGGGNAAGGTVVDAPEKYNPVTNTWATGFAASGVARVSAGTLKTSEDSFVYIGGQNAALTYLGTVQEYLDTLNVWQDWPGLVFGNRAQFGQIENSGPKYGGFIVGGNSGSFHATLARLLLRNNDMLLGAALRVGE